MTITIPKWSLAIVPVLVALLLATSAAGGQEASVPFRQKAERYIVRQNGQVIGRTTSESEAIRIASDAKIEDPSSRVLYVAKARFVARAPRFAPTTTSTTSTAPPVTIKPQNPSPDLNWTRPRLFETRTDPVYGTPVTRVSDATGTRFNRNTYSRRNPENANGTYFMTYHGEAEYRVYRLSDGELVRVTDIHPDGEPQWHATDPDILRHVAGSNSSSGKLKLFETSIRTGNTSEIADLTGRLQARFPGAVYMIDRAEGAPSADGSRYAWIVYNADENPIGIVHYDLTADNILGTLDVDPSVEYRLDWVSTTPTGNYVIAGFWEGTFAYDADMSNRRELHDDGEHSDIALDADGNDTYVFINFSANSTGGWAIAKDVATGEETLLFDLYDDANTSIHFSGKAYDRPGWVVASTYSCKEDTAWSCEKVFLVNVDTGEIRELAHTYNCGEDYWTETHAATNRDLSRVYFNSDAGSCGINAEVYRLDVRHDSGL